MKSLLIVIGVLVGLGLIVVLPLLATYNNFVGKSQAVDEQWAQVETQYQRRFDLIPNLVESVKGAMAQERAVFETIANARTRYAGAATVNEKAASAGELESAFARLLVIMENYPQLRSIERVGQLMDELAGTENRISVERRRYNQVVRDYNTSIKKFPGVMLAGAFGFTERNYFTSTTGADVPPKVEF